MQLRGSDAAGRAGLRAAAELGSTAGSRRRRGRRAERRRAGPASRRRRSTSSSCIRRRSSARRAGTSRSTTPRPISSPTCSSCAARRRCSTAAAGSTRRAIGRRRSSRSWTARAAARRRCSSRTRMCERAFDYFIEHYNQGRPFILAGHSQGSVHVRTLLEKRITGTPLRERLVAAYPIGFSIDREAMAKAVPDVPVCESAEQIGCVVSWNAVGPDAAPWGDPRKNICVNPLTWRTDGAAADSLAEPRRRGLPGHVRGHARRREGRAAGVRRCQAGRGTRRRRRAMRRRHAAGQGDPFDRTTQRGRWGGTTTTSTTTTCST